jgi:hypothetical protein
MVSMVMLLVTLMLYVMLGPTCKPGKAAKPCAGCYALMLGCLQVANDITGSWYNAGSNEKQVRLQAAVPGCNTGVP